MKPSFDSSLASAAPGHTGSRIEQTQRSQASLISSMGTLGLPVQPFLFPILLPSHLLGDT